MFGVSKEELIQGLENLRKRLCCYSPQPTCDCKYGIEWVEKPTKEEAKENPEEAHRRMRKYLSQQQSLTGLGEQTGCPELRQVIAILETMSDECFRRLSIKARAHITDDNFVGELNNALGGKYKIVDGTKEEWTDVQNWKFVGRDMHITKRDGGKLILKDARIELIKKKIEGDGLIVEEPKMIYEKVNANGDSFPE